jgi:phospholipase C
VLVFNFDEWGGFFDHVPPQNAPDVEPAYTLRGFRVPCLIVSPWSRRGYVGTNIYDHTSVLKMIEWRWNLEPLSARDSAAANIAEVLDFNSPNLNAPQYMVLGPYTAPCETEAAREPVRREPNAMLSLYNHARQRGWLRR